MGKIGERKWENTDGCGFSVVMVAVAGLIN